MKYFIDFHTDQAQVTAKVSADGVINDLITAGAYAITNFARVLVDGCKRFRDNTNLQGFGNVECESIANLLFTCVRVFT